MSSSSSVQAIAVNTATFRRKWTHSSYLHVEHIVAKQHLGSDDPENLALACNRCNGYKGPNLSSIDPSTNEIVMLYHPRREIWNEHFVLHNGEVLGSTLEGRATVRLLNMNAPRRVELRNAWIGEGGEIL